MNSHDNDRLPVEEPKDRTRWVWLGVVALVALLALALWLGNRPRMDTSRVRVKHILIAFDNSDPTDRARALELITDLRDRLEKGASFSNLARQYSNDEYSSARGGDLGFHKKGSFEGAFEDYVWKGPIGELSDIVQTNFGFHLVVVTERHISQPDLYEMELERKALEEQQRAPAGAPAPADGT